MASNTKSSKSKKKKKSEQEIRNDKLRAKYAKEMENYERTSNQILNVIRQKGVSVHAPNPSLAPKQAPEEITDIHIVFSQQLPKYAKEGEDDSEEKEKKASQTQANSTNNNNDDSKDKTNKKE